ncbi:MAG: hypothetical protein K6G88_01360 [Lachnospiraceae bacterium]|nr:hypothetical protein [Lachnospiraceae bacterium]
MDLLYWNEDRTKVPREVFINELDSIIDKDSWIIDGNYGSTMEKIMIFTSRDEANEYLKYLSEGE